MSTLNCRPLASRILRGLLIGVLATAGCDEGKPSAPSSPPPADLAAHCANEVGPPRIQKLTPTIAVARGFDLANTTVIRTSGGLVVIDPGMTTSRAQRVRAAFDKEGVSGPVAAIVFTHSHIDHVGGAKAWVDDQAQPPDVWATDAFLQHIWKQYGVFRPAEAQRGARQFGYTVDEETLPCIAIGRRIDLDGAMSTGMRLPTHTFSGQQVLTFGQTEIHLVEAHGETHDQLFVWLPSERALFPGDNYYASFPNLYTIRGTTARPVDEWVASIDHMRTLQATYLVPSHTSPLSGEATVAEHLTAYRDAISFTYDHVVRGANQGLSLDTIVESFRLPPHLAHRPELQTLYGDLGWSIRGIYSGAIGWFDGQPEALYPMLQAEAATLDIQLIGASKLRAEAAQRLANKQPRAALHLLMKLRRAGRENEKDRQLRVNALRALAEATTNTNGRGYLLTAAAEIDDASPLQLKRPLLDDQLLKHIPLEVFFKPMSSRLKVREARDYVGTVAWVFDDEQRRFWVTIRRGVAEIADGSPLPGTPTPFATIRTTGLKWRRLATQIDGAATALWGDDFRIDGDLVALGRFLGMFERGF